MIAFDAEAIRLTRLDLGLPQRSLAKAVGLSGKIMSDLENGRPGAGNEALLPLQRLVDTLGVPLSSLLADDTPSGLNNTGARAPEHGPDDMAALGALLLHTAVNTPKTNLADSLGWTLDRLRLAAAALDHHLRPLGMQVHSLRGGYRLRPLDAHQSARTSIDRLTASDHGMSKPEAELVHKALNGTLITKRLTNAHRPLLGRLLRTKVLVEDKQTASPGAALLDALDVPDS